MQSVCHFGSLVQSLTKSQTSWTGRLMMMVDSSLIIGLLLEAVMGVVLAVS